MCTRICMSWSSPHFLAVGYWRPPANKPRPAFARRRRSNRGCVIGTVVRSAALVRVLPGRQERQFAVTAVGVKPYHLPTRRVTVCHFPLWLGPRRAPRESSRALPGGRDKTLLYWPRA